MIKSIIKIACFIVSWIITDKIMYNMIRKIDKKERKKIDEEELKVYTELLDKARQLDESEKDD